MAPIHILIVPNGCSTVCLRVSIFFGSLAKRSSEYKELIVTLRTVLEGFEIDIDYWFTEYPELALEIPSPDKVESLGSKITNAQTLINSNQIVQLLSAR